MTLTTHLRQGRKDNRDGRQPLASLHPFPGLWLADEVTKELNVLVLRSCNEVVPSSGFARLVRTAQMFARVCVCVCVSWKAKILRLVQAPSQRIQ